MACLETFRANCSGYHIYQDQLYQLKWHTYLDCPRLLGEQQLTYNNIITILFINGRPSSINFYLLCNKAIWLIDTVLYVLSHNRNPIFICIKNTSSRRVFIFKYPHERRGNIIHEFEKTIILLNLFIMIHTT